MPYWPGNEHGGRGGAERTGAGGQESRRSPTSARSPIAITESRSSTTIVGWRTGTIPQSSSGARAENAARASTSMRCRRGRRSRAASNADRRLRGRTSHCEYRAGALFAMKFDPAKQQPFLVAMPSPDAGGIARVIVDPNAGSDKGSISIQFYVPSLDGKLVAAALTENGSEDSAAHIFETATGKELRRPRAARQLRHRRRQHRLERATAPASTTRAIRRGTSGRRRTRTSTSRSTSTSSAPTRAPTPT